MDKVNIKASGNKWIINGEENIAGSITSNTHAPIALFGICHNGDIFQKDSIKVYNLKIYDGDTILRDFIPCKDKNDVVCMYDKVEGKYYYNQGTGDFVAGPEV